MVILLFRTMWNGIFPSSYYSRKGVEAHELITGMFTLRRGCTVFAPASRPKIEDCEKEVLKMKRQNP